ncbi:MAG: DUF1684 domain-containing protein [Pseudomonadota bacterium]
MQDTIDQQIPRLALADWRRRLNALYAEVRAEAEPEVAWRRWHRSRSQLFREHPVSPLAPDVRTSFKVIPVYPYDPDLRLEVVAVPIEGPTETVPLDEDGEFRRRPIARTRGLAPTVGAELTLWWIEGYGGGLFLPFTDATSGRETYGGGRYLLDAIKGADLGSSEDGRLMLDFNFAYHPSCAWNDDWTCPLAPEDNRLPAPIRGGERLVEWI